MSRFLEEIFANQPGKYICISLKNRDDDYWSDRFFESVEEAVSCVEKYKKKPGYDLYFCPTKLNEPRRLKRNVTWSAYLWADLDFVDPKVLQEGVKPSHAWESSPKRFQALWKLDKPYQASEVEQKTKGLAYALGADKGGWDLTQVLRVPGTRNYKYKERPVVRVLWANDSNVRHLSDFPDVASTDKREHGEKASLDPHQLAKLLGKYKGKIRRDTYRLLTAKEAVGDRSRVLFKLAHALMAAGVKRNHSLELLRSCVWNKYKDRSDEIESLERDLDKASENVKKEVEAPEEDQKLYTRSLEFVPLKQFMTQVDRQPGWLVKDFWTRASHGIVAGEPKSFKSTLITDLAISVASGKPFLGHYEIVERGPVLYVQNENADWIMRDRIAKIMGYKRLLGFARYLFSGDIEVKFPRDLPIEFLSQQGFHFTSDPHLALVEETIERVHPKLIIFDPLYLMFSGDLNSSEGLHDLFQWLLYLKTEWDVAVLLVHHWNKGKPGSNIRGGQRMLGSTTLHGWVESAWYLSILGDVLDEDLANEFDNIDPERKPREISEKDEGGPILATRKISIEREFRGAGIYPKLEVGISMGKPDSDEYEIFLRSGDVVTMTDIEVSARALVLARQGELSLYALRKACKLSFRKATQIVNLLRERDMIDKKGRLSSKGIVALEKLENEG